MTLTNLDQGGGRTRYTRVWAGPSIGWVEVPVATETMVTAAGDYQAVLGDVYILVNKTVPAANSVLLPDVALWVKGNMTQTFGVGFDRSLTITDYAGNASTNNITITPFGAQTINGFSSWTIGEAFSTVCLRPLSDLSGWFVT